MEDQFSNTWTAEAVQERMVEAFAIEKRAPLGRNGAPSSGGSGWPSQLVVMAKARDEMLRGAGLTDVALKELEVASRDDLNAHEVINSSARIVPTAQQLSQMEAALAWPLTYLRDHPREADALTLFSFAKATRGFDLRPFLQERAKVANDRAERMNREFNDKDPSQAENRALRRDIAKQVADDANRRIEDREETREVIEQAARWHFASMCKDAACSPVVRFSPQDAFPDMVLSRTSLDRNRRRAAKIIADGLVRDGIAPPHEMNNG